MIRYRLALSALFSWVLLHPAQSDAFEEPLRRRPVGLILSGDRLLVANRESGTVSLVNTSNYQVINETKVGSALSGLRVVPGTTRLLATDETEARLILLERRDDQLTVVASIDVGATPVDVCCFSNGDRCSVSSLWARQTWFVRILPKAPYLQLEAIIDLPFAPRLQSPVENENFLVVADSFGGQLGVVDVATNRLATVRRIQGHNIRGMIPIDNGQSLAIAHQLISDHVPTTQPRVFWGTLMSNLIRTVKVDHLLETIDSPFVDHSSPAQPKDIAHWTLEPLGRTGDATGDPTGLVVAATGQRLVCFSGVDQIGIAASRIDNYRRVDVGGRPTAIALDEIREIAYVANTMDDSISVLDMNNAKLVRTISLGPQPPITLADEGERHFFDARLSLDGWFSCHSCHTDGHSNGLRNDNFADDVENTPKRILSLLGTGETGPWTWAGHQTKLREQIKKSIRTTMRGTEDDFENDRTLLALEAYLRSLVPPPSLHAARRISDNAALERGRKHFARLDCVQCHRPLTFTSADVYDVGLADEAGNRNFNPPSLRAVSQRDALFHDNRARNLTDVFRVHHHPNGRTAELSQQEVADLVAFLGSL